MGVLSDAGNIDAFPAISNQCRSTIWSLSFTRIEELTKLNLSALMAKCFSHKDTFVLAVLA